MDKINYDQAVEISEGVYWLGFFDTSSDFRCNPYLVVDGKQAVLIDPGSLPHFPTVARKVFSIVKPEQISHIIIHHQDPDLAASVPVFEKYINRPDLKVITTKRASFLTSYYGIKSPYLFSDEEKVFVFESGRKLKFLMTPYCHAPGAFTTYDEKTKILFSSDIFGAFTEDWKLFATEEYANMMAPFMDFYMPSLDIVNYALNQFKSVDLNMIAPQHGSVIEKNLVDPFINYLSDLKYGRYMENK